ncbi:MAG: copper resistance protein CopC [Acidimicrobiales bacterium]
MRCELCREIISAGIDDEPIGDEREVEAHLASCAECSAFAAGASKLHRRFRIRPAEAVRDHSAEILAAVAMHAPRSDHARSATQASPDRPERGWARYALLWLALTQLALAVPALLFGTDHGADLHVAHEIGSWDAALAFAMLLVAFQPRRATGLLPFVGALSAVLLVTAAIDVAGGHAPAIGEAGHLLTLVGVGLLWLVSRARPDDRPLVRRRARTAPLRHARLRDSSNRSIQRSLVAAIAAVAFGAVGLVASATPASAHAILVSASPADGSVLHTPPTRVVLTFSESVTINLRSLRVVNADGRRVDRGDVTHGGSSREVRVSLDSHLPVGTYVVGWSVISADTHPVHGGFLFSVGSKTGVAKGVVASLASPSGATIWQTVSQVLRWAAYVGALLAAGLAVFQTWIAGAKSAATDGLPRRLTSARLVYIGGIAAAVTTAMAVVTDAAGATGLGIASIFHAGVLGQVLGGGMEWTVIGIAVAAVLAAWAVRSVADGTEPSRPMAKAIALAAVAAVSGAFAASGHSTSTSPEALVLLADTVHVGAAAIWFGGLVGLVVAIRAIRRAAGSSTRADQTSEADNGTAIHAAKLVARFSRVATWALAAVTIAGLTLAWREVRAVRALTSTTYGWLLIAKVGVVALVALVAAYNHYRLTPAVRHRPTASARWSRLRTTLRVEVALLVVVLALTAVLTDTIPASTAAGIGTVASRTATFGPGSVQVVVDPARRGNNAMHMYVLDKFGSPYDRLSNVRVELSLPAANLGPIEREAFHAGPGHWQVDGNALTVAGQWRLTILAQPDQFTEWQATVTVRIQP